MTKRIEFIDALRGFTMILVVFAHVETMGIFSFTSSTVVGRFFQLFRMPLFFFISGYIAYKADFQWNVRNTMALVGKKLKVQIIPTLFWGSLFTIIFCGGDFRGFAMSTEKYGYWFTIALLEMFLIYYAVSFFSSSKWRDAVLVAVALALFACKFPMKAVPALNSFGEVSSMHYTCTYFQYFVFGNLASRYRDTFHRLLDNKYVMALVILLMMALSYLVIGRVEAGSSIVRYIFMGLGVVCGYFGITIVFGFFRRHEPSVSSATRVGSVLQYIGKRTLDIYLLHYFFIPDLSFLNGYLQNGQNTVMALLVGISVSLVIVGLCLLVSNVIRLSPFLAEYLFGVKQKSPVK